MSVIDTVEESVDSELKSSKRKREDALEELEIDVNASEPPSKKALRKARKSKPGQAVLKDESAVKNKGSQGSVAGNEKPGIDAEKDPLSNRNRSGYGIWIGNLSFTTTKEDLQNFLTTDTEHPINKEQITRIHLPSGPARLGKPQNKGFAYVDFTDKTTLYKGLELSEKLLGGRRVLIKDAKSFEGRPASKEDVAAGKAPSRRIFVGNLSFDTNKEALEEHFGVCGAITKVQVATFEDSGKCKGYAWVEFEQLSSAQSAMRGWVEEGSEGGAKQSKRRVWLKKMADRQLRMEFAEDATTRYNKRYGKDAKKASTGSFSGEQAAPIEEVEEDTMPTRHERPRKEHSKYVEKRRGYEDSTVQRLTGAIPESKGTKVVFD